MDHRLNREPHAQDEEEAVIDRFMNGGTRKRDLIDLIDALTARIRALKIELAATTDAAHQKELEHRLKSTREQIAVLNQEMAVSEFVEDSVRMTMRNERPLQDEFDEEEEF